MLRQTKPRRIFNNDIFYFARVFSRSSDAQDYAEKKREHGKLARVTTETTKQGKRHFVWVR